MKLSFEIESSETSTINVTGKPGDPGIDYNYVIARINGEKALTCGPFPSAEFATNVKGMFEAQREELEERKWPYEPKDLETVKTFRITPPGKNIRLFWKVNEDCRITSLQLALSSLRVEMRNLKTGKASFLDALHIPIRPLIQLWPLADPYYFIPLPPDLDLSFDLAWSSPIPFPKDLEVSLMAFEQEADGKESSRELCSIRGAVARSQRGK